MASKIKVIDLFELPPGKMIRVEIQGEAIVVVNSDGKIFAMVDSCPHADWPLSKGDLDGNILTCLLHGAEFDVTNGCSVGSFACADVPGFPVVVGDGKVYVLAN